MNILDFSIGQFKIFWLILFRVFGILFYAPLFGSKNIPTRVKIGLAMMVSLTVFPLIGNQMIPLPDNAYFYFLFVIKEFIIGMILGLVTLLLFVGVQFTGQIIGLEMGFTIVNVIDPQSNLQVSIIGQIYYLIVIMLFLTLNGHYLVIKTIVNSFRILPIHQFDLNTQVGELLIKYSSQMFELAVEVGAPIIVILFLASAALGIMARVVPQMNIFVIGFPIKIGLGLFGIALSVVFFYGAFLKIMHLLYNNITELLKAL